MNTSIKKYS